MDVPSILIQQVVKDRGLLATFEDVEHVGRPVTVVRTGIKLDGSAPAVSSPPPELGSHNAEIYGELGISGEELQSLRNEGVI